MLVRDLFFIVSLIFYSSFCLAEENDELADVSHEIEPVHEPEDEKSAVVIPEDEKKSDIAVSMQSKQPSKVAVVSKLQETSEKDTKKDEKSDDVVSETNKQSAKVDTIEKPLKPEDQATSDEKLTDQRPQVSSFLDEDKDSLAPTTQEQQDEQDRLDKEASKTDEEKLAAVIPQVEKPVVKDVTASVKQTDEDKAVQDDDTTIVVSPDVVAPKKANVKPFISPVKAVVPQTVVNPAEQDSSSVSKQSVVATHVQPISVVKAVKPIIAQSDETMADAADVDVADVVPVSGQGLNTLRIDSAGNWLEKRIWYEKAQQLFEVIRGTIQKASDVRMKFVHEVNQTGQKIDDFYEKIGFQKGHIDELLTAITSDIATDKEIRGGDLTSNERSLRLKVRTTQTQLESISKDLQLIKTLDDQIDKTMEKAFKEIEACRSLETRAWNNFKDIGMELDDKKARVLFYEMENFHKNIEQKMQYLQTNLLQYLQAQLVSKVAQTITQITTNAATIATQATSIQTMLQKDASGDFTILKQRDEELAKAELNSEAQKQAKAAASQSSEVSKKNKELAWYESLADYAHAAYVKILELLTIIVCCIKTLFCNIKQIICGLFGS